MSVKTQTEKCPHCQAQMTSVWICDNAKHYLCCEDCYDNHDCEKLSENINDINIHA